MIFRKSICASQPWSKPNGSKAPTNCLRLVVDLGFEKRQILAGIASPTSRSH